MTSSQTRLKTITAQNDKRGLETYIQMHLNIHRRTLQSSYPGVCHDNEEKTIKFVVQGLLNHDIFGTAASALI